jgi:tRNA threonylcarbamoyladenosine biosynthesis protein TsaE
MVYMSTKMTLEIHCGELADTLSLGEQIGRNCIGGEAFKLVSDIGGGKTAFVRGLAMGMESDDEVSSPSFTINNSYRGKKLSLEHFDFYRLDDPGIVADELREDVFDDHTVVAVEWGDSVSDVLPVSAVEVAISVDASDTRIFQISYSASYEYLFDGIER